MASPESQAKRVDLPVRDFLYTIDQIAFLVNMTEETLRDRWIFFEDHTPGVQKPTQLRARYFKPALGKERQWRVAERELKRWLRGQGFIVRSSGVIVR